MKRILAVVTAIVMTLAFASGVMAQTPTPEPTPTPSYLYEIALADGVTFVLERRITYGEVMLTTVLLFLIAFLVVSALIITAREVMH